MQNIFEDVPAPRARLLTRVCSSDMSPSSSVTANCLRRDAISSQLDPGQHGFPAEMFHSPHFPHNTLAWKIQYRSVKYRCGYEGSASCTSGGLCRHKATMVKLSLGEQPSLSAIGKINRGKGRVTHLTLNCLEEVWDRMQLFSRHHHKTPLLTSWQVWHTIYFTGVITIWTSTGGRTITVLPKRFLLRGQWVITLVPSEWNIWECK